MLRSILADAVALIRGIDSSPLNTFVRRLLSTSHVAGLS